MNIFKLTLRKDKEKYHLHKLQTLITEIIHLSNMIFAWNCIKFKEVILTSIVRQVSILIMILLNGFIYQTVRVYSMFKLLYALRWTILFFITPMLIWTSGMVSFPLSWIYLNNWYGTSGLQGHKDKLLNLIM